MAHILDRGGAVNEDGSLSEADRPLAARMVILAVGSIDGGMVDRPFMRRAVFGWSPLAHIGDAPMIVAALLIHIERVDVLPCAVLLLLDAPGKAPGVGIATQEVAGERSRGEAHEVGVVVAGEAHVLGGHQAAVGLPVLPSRRIAGAQVGAREVDPLAEDLFEVDVGVSGVGIDWRSTHSCHRQGKGKQHACDDLPRFLSRDNPFRVVNIASNEASN